MPIAGIASPHEDDGSAQAKIAPLTSQNQAQLESDVRRIHSESLDVDDRRLATQCEAPDPQPRSAHQLSHALPEA